MIEDNAQGFGAEYKGKKTGSLGGIACLSLFPTKNLDAYGEGGMAVTNDPAQAERMRRERTHGWKRKYFSKKEGVSTEVYYPLPPHLAEPCQKPGFKRGDFPDAERASQETLALPLYP